MHKTGIFILNYVPLLSFTTRHTTHYGPVSAAHTTRYGRLSAVHTTRYGRLSAAHTTRYCRLSAAHTTRYGRLSAGHTRTWARKFVSQSLTNSSLHHEKLIHHLICRWVGRVRAWGSRGLGFYPSAQLLSYGTKVCFLSLVVRGGLRFTRCTVNWVE